MITKFNVGDNVLIKGVVENIHIETTDNEPIYHVRVKGAGTYEAYGIRIKECDMKGDNVPTKESLTESDLMRVLYPSGTKNNKRPQGSWIVYNKDMSNEYYKCPDCKTYQKSPYNFCPHCGADMRSENKFQDLVVFDDQPKRQLEDPDCHNEL